MVHFPATPPLFLAFPRILAGSGPTSWIVLVAIVLLVGIVFYVVYRQLQK